MDFLTKNFNQPIEIADYGRFGDNELQKIEFTLIKQDPEISLHLNPIHAEGYITI